LLEPDASAIDHLERGRALLNDGKLNEAVSELSLATSMDPKLADAKNLLGVAYGQKRMTESARKCFEAALKLDKNNSEILNNLGYLLYANGDYSAALDRLKKAARLAPDDKRVLTNLALAQSRLGKFDDAYKNFVRAGGEVAGRLNLANRLQLAGRSDEALKQFEAAKLQAAKTGNDNDTQAITVVMEIRNGLVTFASIAHPRPGMGAYEASALRIARQRRYPADKNGQESVVVKITPFPAS
ncbi:MAG TPA: tetratricopeptide repeat protein, partial [Pyrinomonadaceae bacterium]